MYIITTMKMVPAQHKGASSATKYTIKLPAITAAKALFEKAKQNLLNVNNWHTLAGALIQPFSRWSTVKEKK